MGSDGRSRKWRPLHPLFQSTLPGWGATASRAIPSGMESDFNPRSPDGERQSVSACNVFTNLISIHAPRMGSDMGKPTLPITLTMISIHAPRMGSDMAQGARPETRESFQSTLPGWGATSGVLVGHATLRHFNPRSPDGERHGIARHRPRSPRFQSTLPGWGATCASAVGRARPCDFNPRSPDGERPGTGSPLTFNGLFQSTLPGWGATYQI